MDVRNLAWALVAPLIVLVACGGTPAPTPTTQPRVGAAQIATAQAVVAATTLPPLATASPTPGPAAALGPFRIWELGVTESGEIAGHRPSDGEHLVRVDILIENAQLRPVMVTPGALVGAATGKPNDTLIRFELDGGGAMIPAASDLYPTLAPVVLPPGYGLPQTLLFLAPADLTPTRLIASAQRGAGRVVLDLTSAGTLKPALPSRAPFMPKQFAQAVDVLQGYEAAVVAVGVRDGRVRARVEAQNKTTSPLETGRLVGAQIIGADGDVRTLESSGAPTLTLIDGKGSWEMAEPVLPPSSWYAAKEFHPVQVLLVLRSMLHPDQVAEYATFPIPPEELSPPAPVAGLVTTLAGSTLDGYTDRSGAAASFAAPVGIAVSAHGDVYVGDSHNNRVRRIAADGAVTTVAGGAASGASFADGPAAEAKFFEPRAIAIDEAGTLFVADSNNNRVRKIALDGQVATLAGGPPGDADGPGAAARFRYPRGIAVDPAGVVYVTDKDTHRIRKIGPDGVVSTLTGGAGTGYVDGPLAEARFAFPEGLAVGADGSLFVADAGNHRIRRVSADGQVTTVAGGAPGYADGVGSAARFNTPRGVAVDGAGDVYVADAGNHRIRKVAPDGTVATVAGSGERGYANGAGTAARFNEPSGVAVDAQGNLYVADQNNNRVRKIAGPL